MRVIIYESSARGGNFKYALELFKAYRENKQIEKVTLLIPRNSSLVEDSTAILLSDRIDGQKVIQQFHFIWRNLINPFILFFFLLRKRKSLVILNDFEQLTAPLWAPLFRLFLRKHILSVFLHDPDRDQYPPAEVYSAFSMKVMMSAMKLGFFHEHLPDKPYYKEGRTRYICVPHGIYTLPSADEKLKTEIANFKSNSFLLSIIGNIRKEKNYEMAIHCLETDPDLKLLIAGNPASSAINIQQWMHLAENKKVQDRLFWCVRYLSEPEMRAAIELSDCILLNYSSAFTSQSGIFNMLAPFRKPVIISNTESGLAAIAKRFELGDRIAPDSLEELVKAVSKIKMHLQHENGGWEKFLGYASWKRQVEIVVDATQER